MKAAILKILKEHTGSYVSGESLSARLAISRAAVWKHIQALRRAGYEIDSQPHAGYRLRSVPDALTPEAIKSGLQTTCFGQEIHYYHEVSSTNTVAKTAAAAGAPEGTVIIAETQQAGKGRLGRAWYSPADSGIWLSIILRPRLEPRDAPQLTFLTAVAAVRAIKEVAGCTVQIKWPNDLLIAGRKLAGIFTEMSSELGLINYLVIGIGINVNLATAALPADLKETATSLQRETGQKQDRARLVQQLLLEMEHLYHELQTEGFARIREEWLSYTQLIGRWVKVTSLKGELEGKVVDISADGALILALADGTRQTIVAGDVSLRGRDRTYGLF